MWQAAPNIVRPYSPTFSKKHRTLTDCETPHPQHTHLAKCVDDPNTYMVNDVSDPLQRSLTSLQLTDVLLGAPPPGACFTYAPISSATRPLGS